MKKKNKSKNKSRTKAKAKDSVGGFKQYNTKSHADGGQLVNNLGVPDMKGSNEVEGTENKFTFKNLSTDTYIYSDENSTSPLASAIMKKYSKGKVNPDMDEPTRNALEMEMMTAKKINEYIKNAKESQQGQGEMKQGGITEYNNGGTTNPLSSPIPAVASLNSGSNYNIPIDIKDYTKTDFSKPGLIDNLKGNLNNDNIGQALTTVGMLGNVANLFAKPEIDTPIKPDYRNSDAQMALLDTNLEQSRQDALAINKLSSNLNRNSTGSYSQYNQREMQNLSSLQNNLGNISQQEVQLQNNIALAKSNYEQSKAVTNANADRQSREINDQNEAANRNIKRGVFSDLVAEGDRLRTIFNQDKIAKMSTAETMNVLKAIYPDFEANQGFYNALEDYKKGTIDYDEFVKKLSEQDSIKLKE